MTAPDVHSSGWLRRTAFGLCIAVSGYGYVSGWPAWLVLLILLGMPLSSGFVWLLTGRFRRYRFLFGIYGVVAVIATFEAWQYQTIPESVTKSIDLPPGPGAPNLFLESDLPRVLFELYPDRSEVLFIRAFQMKLCNDEGQQRYSVCDQFEDTDLATVRQYFETALTKNSKTDENLYYHYVEILMRLQAPQSEIAAAAREWKRLFPLSERPDPRAAFAGVTRAKAEPKS